MLIVLLLAAACALAAATWRSRGIDRRHPPVGQVRWIDGRRLHVLTAGDPARPAVVLLHGASSNLKDFAASLMPALAEHCYVIAIDRPGMGHSPPSAGWLNPGDLADMAVNVAEELGAHRPVIVGHSWSGAVVLSALTDQAHRVAGGISLSGVAGHWVGGIGWPTHVARVPVLGPAFCRLVVPLLGPRMMPAAIRKILAPNPVPAGYAESIGAELALRPANFVSNARDLVRLNGYLQAQSTHYAAIERPLLLLHGADDIVVPFWNHGARVASLVDSAQVELLPGVGHAPHHVDANDVASRIVRFVEQCQPTTR